MKYDNSLNDYVVRMKYDSFIKAEAFKEIIKNHFLRNDKTLAVIV